MASSDLKKAGLKVTLPRMKILEILEREGNHHLSAEDIYRTLIDSKEEIGLATVYRVLTQFEAAGIVIRHHFEGGQGVFELNRGSHDHIVCSKTGKIVEFFDQRVADLLTEIAEENGFELTERSVVLYGVHKDAK